MDTLNIQYRQATREGSQPVSAEQRLQALGIQLHTPPEVLNS